MYNRCGGFVLLPDSGIEQEIPEVWQRYFRRQTLKTAESADSAGFHLIAAGLPPEIAPSRSTTLLEQFAWALLVRPSCQAILQPLYISLSPGPSVMMKTHNPVILERIISSGFIALLGYQASEKISTTGSRQEVFKLILAKGDSVEIVSRALLEEKEVVDSVSPPSSFVQGMQGQVIGELKKRLSVKQKVWLKRQLHRVRSALPNQRDQFYDSPRDELAIMKTWDPAFLKSTVAVDARKKSDRIPILMATHWLELGGAEKFAIDLIKALPKDKYAIYVTTDVSSQNSWSEALTDKVEEIVHLPEFLPPHLAPAFYEHYIRSRDIRLVHIHHAPRAYESLAHIRRFHPKLKVLDSLHIIELPPNSGGYPEIVGREFEVFIDHHHVVSKHMQHFLLQRWCIPQEKTTVIYLNVDTEHFDPSKVEKGKVRAKLAIPTTACLIGFIGRMVEQKRPLEFVRTAELILRWWQEQGSDGEVHFLMVGSGPLYENVQDAIVARSLSSWVHLPGEVELDDIRQVYGDLDLLIMPSANEGLALVTYEAMAMTVPVFCTDVGAQSELLQPEFLLPNQKPIAPKLAQAMRSYILDGDKRKEVGRKLRRHILKHHRMEQTYSQIVDLYQRLL